MIELFLTEKSTDLGGGISLKAGDEIVGAIGVSGGTGEQDATAAEAGMTAFSAE